MPLYAVGTMDLSFGLGRHWLMRIASCTRSACTLTLDHLSISPIGDSLFLRGLIVLKILEIYLLKEKIEEQHFNAHVLVLIMCAFSKSPTPEAMIRIHQVHRTECDA